MIFRHAGTAATLALVAIGALHVAWTPLVHDAPTDAAAWFAGSGLALIFSGVVNVVAARSMPGDRVVWWLRQVVNGLTVWIAGFVVSQLPGALSVAVLSAAVVQALAGLRGTAWQRPSPAR